VTVKHFDAVVVGCGAMGSSISFNLASRGLKVLTLERFGLNHEFGSSHGKTRIIRLAYFEDPRYVPLLRRAFACWDELAKRSGAKIMKRTGGLMVGREGGPLVTGVLRSAKEHSLPHRRLSSREAGEVFGALRLEEGYSGVYEGSAGVLFPEQCISSYVSLAQEAGGTFGFSERVTSWKPEAEHVEVLTEKGEYEADRLVLAAGAWTGQLLNGLVPLECERQVQFWFRPAEGGAFSAERMPVFIMEEDDERYFYGIPDVGDGVKVARSHGGETVDPDKVERRASGADLAPVRDFVVRRLPGLNHNPISSAVCMYTNTPDSNFVVDLHPEDRRVLVVSACSGHGFKFSSFIGEVAADLLLNGRSGYDLSFLRIGRFLKA